jgi:hypothetical protein
MSNNQDEWFRRAGAGIYAWDHEMNLSLVVPRLLQTNQRVELLAVLVACLLDPRPLDIRTCNGFACWQSWVSKGWRENHEDLLESHVC